MADGGQLKLQMGLGKTVELLACLLAHPFTPAPQPLPPKPNLGSNKVHKLLEHSHSCDALRIHLLQE